MVGSVKVKICGITNLGDAKEAVDAGCAALGFVFYKKSPRYVSPLKASQIIGKLPGRIKKVGVFVNAREKNIKRIAQLCGLDMLQFHGKESPDFCRKFKGYKIIKAFRIKNRIDMKNVLRYTSFAYLFDTYVKSKAGGTGRKFNWQLLKRSGNIKHPLFLSGGLTKENVREAIRTVRPAWVDVSSSVEIMPGKKDHRKVREFIQIAKHSFF